MELKNKGNAALSAERFEEAIAAYTEALELDSQNHVLFSNRSAAYAMTSKFEEALSDAEQTIAVNPTWPKGYSRKGAALAGLNRYTEALEAYDAGKSLTTFALLRFRNIRNIPISFAGLQHDPTNASLLNGQAEVKPMMMRSLYEQMDPAMLAKFAQMDPSLFGNFTSKGSSSDSSGQQRPSEPAAKPAEPEPMDVDADLPDNKRAAKLAKNLGNEAYKKKSFEEAIKHYTEAIEHDASDITFYSNLAAVYFETKDFDKCIEECERGIEIGRENRADFKLIAKAFARIGNAKRRQGDLVGAKTNLEKSLSEHRTPAVKAALSEVEKKIKDAEVLAYIDPVKAEEEKDLGNKLFKKGDYATAIKHYSEAIKRNPSDPKLYSNRAACYTKLAAFDLGLKDCDKCLELDEKFVKGYVRRGKILQGMQQPYKALSAYQKAIEIDPTNAEALESYRQCSTSMGSNPQEVGKRAMADPEVQQILKDPAMRVILEQMQQDPKAIGE